MSRSRILFLVRRVIFGLALVALAYLYWRFEVVRLPDGGCSPLMRFGSGSALVVDKHPPIYEHSDAVFFEGPSGGLFLGVVETSQAAGFWLTTDNPQCSGRASEEFGVISLNLLRGRVLFAVASRN